LSLILSSKRKLYTLAFVLNWPNVAYSRDIYPLYNRISQFT
jgi:hypothetical protein